MEDVLTKTAPMRRRTPKTNEIFFREEERKDIAALDLALLKMAYYHVSEEDMARLLEVPPVRVSSRMDVFSLSANGHQKQFYYSRSAWWRTAVGDTLKRVSLSQEGAERMTDVYVKNNWAGLLRGDGFLAEEVFLRAIDETAKVFAISLPSLEQIKEVCRVANLPSITLKRAVSHKEKKKVSVSPEILWQRQAAPLRAMWDKKLSVEIIAERLGRSVEDVKAQAAKLQLGEGKEKGAAKPETTSPTKVRDALRGIGGKLSIERDSHKEASFVPFSKRPKGSAKDYAAWQSEAGALARLLRTEVGKFKSYEALIAAWRERPLGYGEVRQQFLGDKAFWEKLEGQNNTKSVSEQALMSSATIPYKMVCTALDEVVRLCCLPASDEAAKAVVVQKNRGASLVPSRQIIK